MVVQFADLTAKLNGDAFHALLAITIAAIGYASDRQHPEAKDEGEICAKCSTEKWWQKGVLTGAADSFHGAVTWQQRICIYTYTALALDTQTQTHI